MKKDEWTGILVILGIIAVSLFGGSKGASRNGLFSGSNATPEQKQQNITQELNKTQTEVDLLGKQIQTEEDKKTQSQYKDFVSFAYINRSTDPEQEYAVLHINSKATTTIDITGWTLKSTNTGNSVTIPRGTYLYFSGTINSEDDIYVTGGDTIYLITGQTPIGVSFKLNKCSGYLSQFQKFVPYLPTSCPAPRSEDLKSIPKIVVNDACLDYINSFPSCQVETKNFPVSWSYECRNFFQTKISYPSCVNIHKGDKDFYQHEWRAYFRHNQILWKSRRENIILYDNIGKIVSSLTY